MASMIAIDEIRKMGEPAIVHLNETSASSRFISVLRLMNAPQSNSVAILELRSRRELDHWLCLLSSFMDLAL